MIGGIAGVMARLPPVLVEIIAENPGSEASPPDTADAVLLDTIRRLEAIDDDDCQASERVVRALAAWFDVKLPGGES